MRSEERVPGEPMDVKAEICEVCFCCGVPLELPARACDRCGHPLRHHLPYVMMPRADEVVLECVECGAQAEGDCPLPADLRTARAKYVSQFTEEEMEAVQDDAWCMLPPGPGSTGSEVGSEGREACMLHSPLRRQEWALIATRRWTITDEIQAMLKRDGRGEKVAKAALEMMLKRREEQAAEEKGLLLAGIARGTVKRRARAMLGRRRAEARRWREFASRNSLPVGEENDGDEDSQEG